MKKRPIWAVGLGLALIGFSSSALAAITAVPTLSSTPPANQSTTSSELTFNWTQATSDKSSTIWYQYIFGTQSDDYTISSFIAAFNDTNDSAVTRRGLVSNVNTLKLEGISDSTYYFHLLAYDSDGITQTPNVVKTGPLNINSTPSLSTDTPISPASGDHTKLVSVNITGSRFMSGATVSLVDDDDNTTSLTSVIWQSENELVANVPADIAPGTYDLKLTNAPPNSKSVISVDAYTATNQTPTADAGTDQSLTLSSGSVGISLDGSGSSDPDTSDTISSNGYTWTVLSAPSGAELAADQTHSGSTWDTTVSVSGTYQFSLTVTDGYATSSADTIDVVVTNPSGNNPPTANAGTDQVVRPGNEASLSGSLSSDPDSDQLTYTWDITQKPSSSTESAGDINQGDGVTSSSATFTPGYSGIYILSLVVNDGTVDSDADTVTLTVNRAPVASAGDDQASEVTGQQVTLDGSGSSDGDSDTLSYTWTVASEPTSSSVSLSDSSVAQPTFTPTVAGTYQFSLVVNDGTESSSADTVDITVVGNSDPVANAGQNQTVSLSTGAVTLDGSSSSDPEDGTNITYAWLVTSVPSGSSFTTQSDTNLTSASTSAPSFQPDVAGTYIVKLTVTDTQSATSTDTVTVTVSNNSPTANAGADQTVEPETAVTLTDAGSSDPDTDDSIASYSWSLTNVADGSSLSTGVLGTGTTANFTPDVAGSYTVTLTVTDTHGVSGSDTVIVTASSGNSITHTYKAGLNLVPFTISGSSIQTVSQLVGAIVSANSSNGVSVSSVFGWDADAQGYSSAYIITGSGFIVGTDFTLVAGSSYFVEVDGDATLDITGDEFTSLELKDGLNLFSVPVSKVATVTNVSGLVTDIESSVSGAQVESVFSWDSDAQGFSSAYIITSSGFIVGTDFTLDHQGTGYFVEIDGSGTYTP